MARVLRDRLNMMTPSECVAERILRALCESGFVVVPVEPTEAMLQAGKIALPNKLAGRYEKSRWVYRAMIEAAENDGKWRRTAATSTRWRNKDADQSS